MLFLVVGDAAAEAFEREAIGEATVHNGTDDVGYEVGQYQAMGREDAFHLLLLMDTSRVAAFQTSHRTFGPPSVLAATDR